jgi:hypothetical protein
MTMMYARRMSLAGGALLSLLIAVPVRASASGPVAFQATIAETETFAPCSPIIPSLCVTIRGTGHAMDMGRIKETAFVVDDLASNNAGAGCHTEMRETILTAANHDMIALDATGVNCATGKTTLTTVDTFQVVGGSGQFREARSNGTITAHVVIGKTAVVTISGLLSTPGSLP